MSATLQQIYLWALNEQTRLETWEQVQAPTAGQRHARECAAGAVRLVDAVLSDAVILDRLKVAAASRAKAARNAAAAAAAVPS